MGRKKGAKQKPNNENKKRVGLRLYPRQIKIIKLNGESVQEFVDRCVEELAQQIIEEAL